MEETSDTSKMNEDIAVTTKRKQSDIASFFGGSARRKIPKQSTTQALKAGPSTRTLQTTTALKWKSTSLAKYNADEWLLVNESKIDTGLVESLKCATCTKFRDRIISMKGFTTQWSDCGSTRLQHTAAVEHATSEPHKKSFDLFMKQKGLNVKEWNEALKDIHSDNKQSSIFSGLATIQRVDIELTKKKFETAFFIAKEELPLIKYKALLALEEKHGVTLGHAYWNENTGVFIDFIAESLQNDTST